LYGEAKPSCNNLTTTTTTTQKETPKKQAKHQKVLSFEASPYPITLHHTTTTTTTTTPSLYVLGQ